MANKWVGIAILVACYLIAVIGLTLSDWQLSDRLLWPLPVLKNVFEVIFGSVIYVLTSIPAWTAMAAQFLVENYVYLTLMIVGWTAWVCVCALLYTLGEWLIVRFLR